MKSSLALVALVAGTIAAPAPILATSRHHYRHHVPEQGYYYSGPASGYPIAPYGRNAGPYYSSQYGTYPSWTYDPDPNLRAQLRSDFNRGVEFPGNGK
jgi:hypothetical protein